MRFSKNMLTNHIVSNFLLVAMVSSPNFFFVFHKGSHHISKQRKYTKDPHEAYNLDTIKYRHIQHTFKHHICIHEKKKTNCTKVIWQYSRRISETLQSIFNVMSSVLFHVSKSS